MRQFKKISYFSLVTLLILVSSQWDSLSSKNANYEIGINSVHANTAKKYFSSISEQTITTVKIKVRIKAGESPNFNFTSFEPSISFNFFDQRLGINYNDFVSTSHFRLYKLRGPPDLAAC
jgi:hypothetical protein